MKKNIILIIVSIVVAYNANAQKWQTINVAGDELKGIQPHIDMLYSDNSGNIFQIDDKDNNIFVLKTNKAFFDFSSPKGANGMFTTSGIVGLYDQNNHLIEKIDILFEVSEPATICYPNKYTRMGGNNYKRSKKVIDYIKKENGFVRIILPLHNTEEDFDLKIPTLNR